MPSSTDDLRSFFNEGSSSGGPRSSGGDRDRSRRGGGEGRSRSDVRPIREVADRRSDAPDRADPSRMEPRTDAGASQVAVADVAVADMAVADVVAPDFADVAAGDEAFDQSHPEVQPSSAIGLVGARSTATLQKAWIDPEETAFKPVPRPGNPLTARLIAWVGVAAFLGGLAWLIVPEVDFRLGTLQTLQLSEGVLTAQPVQLSPLRPSIVSELYVDASSLPDGVLPEGTPIALLEGTSEDGTRRVTNEIRVPFDARFVSVDTLVGGVVMPGIPVATLYDPSQMYVIVTVRPELLDVMRRGMRARLISEVAGLEIDGVVISAVPLLGNDHEPTTANLVNIRIKPDADAVADLVPGIRFDAVIDLTSAGPDSQPLVFTYAGHVNPSDGLVDEGETVGE